MSADLSRHLRTHSDVKHYKCEVCGKAFSDRSNMRRHKLLHTGVKHYKCVECDAAFADPGNLRRHERTRHLVKEASEKAKKTAPASARKDSLGNQRVISRAANAVPATVTKTGFGNREVPRSSQPQEITTNDADPSVQFTEPRPSLGHAAPAEPSPAEAHLPEHVRENLSSGVSTSTTTPSLPSRAASSSVSNPSGSVAYFGDVVYDRPDDPTSFTSKVKVSLLYESEVYGSFQFVLLDEVEKEGGGQMNIVRLYQCEACLGLSQTHKYKDEVVHTIMTTGQRIVKYDPATPRGILHLCVRHRRSTVNKPEG